MAKRFFYVCAGLFLLAAAYHLGASTATAQAPGNPVVAAVGSTVNGGSIVYTANGDVYEQYTSNPPGWALRGNVFGGSPVPSVETSWGALKVKAK